jgi:hypothetical protein
MFLPPFSNRRTDLSRSKMPLSQKQTVNLDVAGRTVRPSTHLRYLGVTIDHDLGFMTHAACHGASPRRTLYSGITVYHSALVARPNLWLVMFGCRDSGVIPSQQTPTNLGSDPTGRACRCLSERSAQLNVVSPW